MTREIKFRGKRLDGKGWVYGCLLINGENSFIAYYDTPEQYQPHKERVFPNTVGQYTGLKDENGKEIYEGDILRLWRNKGSKGGLRGEYAYPLRVEYCDLWAQFVVVDKANKEQFGIWQQFGAFEVIGNIYDNPEILE